MPVPAAGTTEQWLMARRCLTCVKCRYSAVSEAAGFQRNVRRRQPWQQLLRAPQSPVALCLRPAVYTLERLPAQD